MLAFQSVQIMSNKRQAAIHALTRALESRRLFILKAEEI